MISFYNYTLDELKAFLKGKGMPSYTAQQVMEWVYQKRVYTFEKMTNLSKQIRSQLTACLNLTLPLTLAQTQTSKDGTIKFLFELEGEKRGIESVYIPDTARDTLCVSTQVGCACGCVFCASTKQGMVRDLTAGEIVAQYLLVDGHIRSLAKGARSLSNVVFMGMGEPLLNLSQVMRSISLLSASYGIGLGKRRICVSTCGIVPKIKEFADMHPGVKLSVSLNAITDQKRSRIMPVNTKYPLAVLLKACSYFAKASRYPITFEYILFKDLNMSPDDADQLAKHLSRIHCKINLIPYNPIGGSLCGLEEPSEEAVSQFMAYLKKKHLFCSLRRSKGRDIKAACGTLSLYSP